MRGQVRRKGTWYQRVKREKVHGTGGKEGYLKEIREPVMRSISGIPNGQERVDEKDSDRVMIK
jgi:hypothetical protein